MLNGKTAQRAATRGAAAARPAAFSGVARRVGRKACVQVSAQAVAAPAQVSREQVDRCVNAIRFLAIDAVNKSKSGHPGMPMGCAPMGYVLWNEVMKYNPKNPQWVNRDRFVLSAGHGSMFQYAMLHLAGYDSVTVSWQGDACAHQAHLASSRCAQAADLHDGSRPPALTHNLHCNVCVDGGCQVVPPVEQHDARPPRELRHVRRGGHHW